MVVAAGREMCLGKREDAVPEISLRLSGSPMVAFTPASRRRWMLDHSIDVPDTRAPQDARALATAAAETARAMRTDLARNWAPRPPTTPHVATDHAASSVTR